MNNIKLTTFKNILKKHFDDEWKLFTENTIRQWFIEYYHNYENYEQNPDIEVPYYKDPLSTYKGLLCSANGLKIQPNAKSSKCRADLYYTTNKNPHEEVIEFKFHRDSRYSKCCTGTDMGSLINDFNRLALLDNKKDKYEIYVFDNTMKKYYIKNWKSLTFLDYDNAIVNSIFDLANPPQTILYGKEITKNALSSFDGYDIDKSWDNNNQLNNGENFPITNNENYKIKLVFKDSINNPKISIPEISKNLYIMIYQIIN